MANRRMISKDIMTSDAFLTLPIAAQALYTQIVLDADDRGFCDSPVRLMRMIGAEREDLEALISKRFMLAFDTGVVCVKHWEMTNAIQPSRRTETRYVTELETLEVKSNGAYTEKSKSEISPSTSGVHECQQVVDKVSTTCQQDADTLSTQYRLGKDRIGQVSVYPSVTSLEGGAETENQPGGAPAGIDGSSEIAERPAEDKVRTYFECNLPKIDYLPFFLHYAERGWVDAKGNPIVDWKSAARKWAYNQPVHDQDRRDRGLKPESEIRCEPKPRQTKPVEIEELRRELGKLRDVPRPRGSTLSKAQMRKAQLEARLSELERGAA